MTLRSVNTFVGLSPIVPNCSSVGATQHMQTTDRRNFPRVEALLGGQGCGRWGEGGQGCLEENECNDGPWL